MSPQGVGELESFAGLIDDSRAVGCQSHATLLMVGALVPYGCAHCAAEGFSARPPQDEDLELIVPYVTPHHSQHTATAIPKATRGPVHRIHCRVDMCLSFPPQHQHLWLRHPNPVSQPTELGGRGMELWGALVLGPRPQP